MLNEQKIRLAKERDDLIIASTCVPIHFFTDRDWVLDDLLNVHLTAAGLRAVGTETAGSIAAYLGYGDPEQAGVDPIVYLPTV